ncbi:MAG TPA: FdhF/YdeP family oxidoreductase [Bryobacteraceae bacterium]|nr:FdhF/YdeP family oxidoreductase [Bryobacteraceae bacterium]
MSGRPVLIHQIRRDWKDRWKAAVPLGIGQTKPQHFAELPVIAWKNRDNLRHAWKILSQGVCDGCALGVAGLHDWTMDSVHLCMTRLHLLRLNTMPAIDPAHFEDVDSLQKMSNAQLRELGRLAHPMVRSRGEHRFQRVSWDDALERIASRIRGSDPRRIAFYLTSRGITNETYYAAQKCVRLLGSNNIDNAARLCHSPSTGAMKATLGVGASTCSYKDWYGTDLLIFFGSNPANDQPVAVKYIHEAKRLGTKVVMVNPYKEPGMDRYWIPSIASSALFGTDVADYWFPVAQRGDVAFLYGVIKVLAETGQYDASFVERHTTGFDELRAAALAMPWARIEAESGLSRAGLEEFADLIANAKTAVLVWSMGITQHDCGADTVQMILNLGLMKGFVGREKCGLMPIRGHSGVQGGAEMGAYATAFPGGQPINAGSARALSDAYGFEVPHAPGLSAPEMVEAAHRGELNMLYTLGGNFLRTLPDPAYVAEALGRTPLRVHQDIILTDQALLEPGEETILLPAQTRYEQEGGGTETTTERRIAFSPQIPRQVGEARTEWRILRDLTVRAYPERESLLACDSGLAIREEIARIVPAYEGIQHLARTGDAIQYGGPRLCEGGRFATVDGKAHFRAPAPPRVEREPGTFHVSTRRGRQFNTLIYADVDPLTGADRGAVLMSAVDAAELHLRHGDPIVLKSDAGRFEGNVFLAPIAKGNLQVHWPEGNVLLSRGVCDAAGGVPDYNAVVTVEKL